MEGAGREREGEGHRERGEREDSWGDGDPSLLSGRVFW